MESTGDLFSLTSFLHKPVIVGAVCCRCRCTLYIVDDLPPDVDLEQFFGDTCLVVPPTNIDDFIEIFEESESGEDQSQEESASAGEVAKANRNTNPDEFIHVDKSADGGEDPTDCGDASQSPAEERWHKRGSQRSIGNRLLKRSSSTRAVRPTVPSWRRVEYVMALASEQIKDDHPVCNHCLALMEQHLKTEVDQVAKENCLYEEGIAKIQQELQDTGVSDLGKLEAEINKLEEEERRLLDMLAGIDAEEASMMSELEANLSCQEQLRRDEQDLFINLAELALDIEDSEEVQAEKAHAVQHASRELQSLMHTNVLNQMFHIAYDDVSVSINGFRFMHPGFGPTWEEINAAWGQACLLLDAIVNKHQIPFTSPWALHPLGNFSKVQTEKGMFELHGGQFRLKRFFADRRFDEGISLFMRCLKEVTEFLQKERRPADPVYSLPLKIDGDFINGSCIRLQNNSREEWTKALKYLLIDLKWIIALSETRSFTQRYRPATAAGAGGYRHLWLQVAQLGPRGNQHLSIG